MTRSFFSIALLVSPCIHGLTVPTGSVHAPSRLGDLTVSYEQSEFRVNNRPVQRAFLSPELRGVREDSLQQLLSVGSLRVNQLDDGEYTVAAHVNGDGGGPMLAGATYWTVKTVMWGGLIAGVVTGIVQPEFGGRAPRDTSGPIPAMAAEALVQRVAQGSTGAAAVVAAGAGSTETGRRVTQAAVATVATTGAGVVAAAGGLAGWIEMCSATAAAFAMGLPTP